MEPGIFLLIRSYLFYTTASQVSPHLCAQGPAPYKGQHCPFNSRKFSRSSWVSWRKKSDFGQWDGGSAVCAPGRSLRPRGQRTICRQTFHLCCGQVTSVLCSLNPGAPQDSSQVWESVKLWMLP